jgi:site-specific DNA-methyltransferase (adenine-specific)
MQTNLLQPAASAEANDSRTASDKAVVCKDLLGKIVCGDAYSVLSGLPDNSVDMVFTDPPYKIAQDYGTNIDADRLCSVASIMKTMLEIGRVLKPGRFCAVFYDNRILPLLFDAVRGTQLIYQRQLFVYRSNSVHAFCWHGWMNCTDPICLFVKGGEKRFRPANPPNVKHDCYTRSKMNPDRSGHPAQKPEDVAQHIIEWCCDKDEIVLDPYCGGGSLLRAARLAGRQIAGIEANKKWRDVAQAHVALETGELILPNGELNDRRKQSEL